MSYIYYFHILDISHFQKLTEESSNEFDFHWNAEPYAIGKVTSPDVNERKRHVHVSINVTQYSL